MQMVSGMGLPAYWLSNFVTDLIKVYISCFLIISVMLVFHGKPEGFIPLMMLYPLALVPFTSLTAFMFESEIQA